MLAKYQRAACPRQLRRTEAYLIPPGSAKCKPEFLI